ncbi:hypothetical protein CTA1_4380 [Colletotrichum tanaceti]|uniref:Ecp2 effector protein domain-containing protein n=1 Tax=Colletotrichum tanaceti TaxID=1306861 RepID=A0A4U6X7U0_9PEZI|nr:hypothetical protein CTA1_4380 [Colletotrichum tanaceti]
MKTVLNAFLALALFFATVQASPAVANVAAIPVVEVDAADYASSTVDVAARGETSDAANLQGTQQDLTLSMVDNTAKLSLWCPKDNWVYYYNWGPLVDLVCDRYGNSLKASFSASIPESVYLVDRAKSVTLGWVPLKGGNCSGTCKQVFNAMRNAEDCKDEEFWMKEMINMTYEGCGEASWKYQYQQTPPLKHGSGLCWREKDRPKTYEPKANVFERFCHDAVINIRQKGGWGFMDARARIGYYWTDYNRRVARAGNSSSYFDVGMVHIWIKAPQNVLPCPTKGRYGDHMIEDEKNGLTHELCVKHLNTLQNMDCGQPLGTSQGGRYWADCFEWGIEASGYNALQISG